MKAAFSFFKAALPPTVTSANWAIVDTHGGTAITLTGTRFTGATGVTFGGTACTSVVVVGPTSITCVTPVKAAGTYDFVVTTPSGTGTLAGAVEAWYPTQITNVWAVHDSELGVTQSSNAVSNWSDQTANALAMIQATAAKKPVYTANAFGTRHSLHFTQTGVTTTTSCMGTATKKVLASGLSYFVVAKWTSTDTVQQGYSGDAPLTIISDSTGNIWNSWGASAGNIDYQQHTAGGDTSQLRGSGLNDGTARLIGATHVQSTGVITQYVGATQQGATSTQTYNATFNGYGCLGAGFNFNDGFDGDIGFVVTVNGVISAGDLTKLNNFCKAVWGTP